MIAITIPDKKDFTSKLFLQDTFDSFLLSQAAFTTCIEVSLDGRPKKDYYTEEEWTSMKQHDLIRWSLIKPLCFQIIKGKKLPEQFRIVLALSEENTQKLLSQGGLPFSVSEIGGLFLNIRYEQEVLTCVTGVSFRTFQMDRSLERTWDEMIRRFLKSKQIPFEEA